MSIVRDRVRLFLAACFYYSGLIRLALWWQRRSKPRLIILSYHRATGGDLRRHMLYFRRHYRVLHLEEALKEFYSLRKEGKQVRDRRIPLVLTFDDGHRDNYTSGFRLARELHVPITIFLIPGYVQSGDYFWWLEGERLVKRAQVEEVTLEGHTYHLRQPEERSTLATTIDTCLRYAPSVKAREAILADMRTMLAVPESVTPEEEDVLPLMWSQVHEMEESGWVSFGAHTMHHHVLANLADVAELQYEVSECRKVLEQQLAHPVRVFAYPIGKFEHFGDAGLQAVKEAGYEYALTSVEEAGTLQNDPLLVPRLVGDVRISWLIMALEALGLLGIPARLRKKYERLFK